MNVWFLLTESKLHPQIWSRPLTAVVEKKLGLLSVNGDWDGSDGGYSRLQSVLVPLRQAPVGGTVGSPVRGVVAAPLFLQWRREGSEGWKRGHPEENLKKKNVFDKDFAVNGCRRQTVCGRRDLLLQRPRRNTTSSPAIHAFASAESELFRRLSVASGCETGADPPGGLGRDHFRLYLSQAKWPLSVSLFKVNFAMKIQIIFWWVNEANT